MRKCVGSCPPNCKVLYNCEIVLYHWLLPPPACQTLFLPISNSDPSHHLLMRKLVVHLITYPKQFTGPILCWVLCIWIKSKISKSPPTSSGHWFLMSVTPDMCRAIFRTFSRLSLHPISTLQLWKETLKSDLSKMTSDDSRILSQRPDWPVPALSTTSLSPCTWLLGCLRVWKKWTSALYACLLPVLP